MKKTLVSPVAILCLFAVHLLVADDNEKTIVSKPCMVLSGADSHVSVGGYQRVLTLDDWARVWQKHKGQKGTVNYDFFYDPLGIPIIDFDQFMVIAIFEGNRLNAAGLMAESILESQESITLRFSKKTYATDTGGKQDAVNADTDNKKDNVYAFFVVPRSKKSLILEEKVYRGKQVPWAKVLKKKPGVSKSDINTTEWKQCIKFDNLREKAKER